MAGPIPGIPYMWSRTDQKWKAPGRPSLGTDPTPTPSTADWSTTNLPWAYSSTSDFTTRWPAGVNIVPLQTGTGDFYTDLQNTVNAAGARCVVQLPAGVFTFNQFRLIGSSGDPLYAFGFWHSNLQGLLGAGADKTFVRFAPNSMSSAQVTAIQNRTTTDGPIQLGFMRLDSTVSTSPILLSGITFQGSDQNIISSSTSPYGMVTPQPAPWQGITFFSDNKGVIVSHCRFQAVGRVSTAAPPFETGHFTSQRGNVKVYNTEFDGRLAPEINSAQPRRAGAVMFNNETVGLLQDVWLHHSANSRYAVNDQNTATTGVYTLTRCKLEQISNVNNTDPVYGALGGWTGELACAGFESTNATINVTDCIFSQDNPFTTGGPPHHFELTTITRDPQGGRLFIVGGQYRDTTKPAVNGFTVIRVPTNTYWSRDGFATTIDVRDTAGGPRKTAYVVSTAQYNALTASSLAAAGITPATHYIVRNS
jgi:hypothetical protein